MVSKLGCFIHQESIVSLMMTYLSSSQVDIPLAWLSIMYGCTVAHVMLTYCCDRQGIPERGDAETAASSQTRRIIFRDDCPHDITNVGKDLMTLYALMCTSRLVTAGADMDTHTCIGFDLVHDHLWA